MLILNIRLMNTIVHRKFQKYNVGMMQLIQNLFHFGRTLVKLHLSLSPPTTTIVPYANRLDPDYTPSNSASQTDPSCLILRQFFNQF